MPLPLRAPEQQAATSMCEHQGFSGIPDTCGKDFAVRDAEQAALAARQGCQISEELLMLEPHACRKAQMLRWDALPGNSAHDAVGARAA